MPVTRRDVLWSLGGGMAGAIVSPMPWKLLDDTAIWTQRRHALPVPARGVVSFRPAACTLCPAGCALRVRLVGARPVAVTAEPRHPLAAGACALGLTLHHLAYHPLRLSAPAVREDGRTQPISLDAAVERIAAAVAGARGAGRSVMLLDRRPGRVVSDCWRELLGALPHGLYSVRSGEGETLAVLQAALERPALLGIDLERTRTLVGFGTPLLEGWDRPCRMLAVRRGLHVVQVDTWRSPTAALADEWVAITPGGEGPLALALAHVLVRDDPARLDRGVPPETRDEVRRALAELTPLRAGRSCGVAPDRIARLARTLAERAPTVAIGGGDPGAGPLSPDAERAIALLNVVLGNLGRGGGLVPRRSIPGTVTPGPAVGLADVAGGSVGVLLLDGADDGRALPWPVLRRVLAKDALVVSLSPFVCGPAHEAGLLVPTPAPLEAWDEVLATPAAAVASYAVSAPVLSAPAGTIDGVALVQRLAAALHLGLRQATHEDRLRERVAAIHAAGRGRLLARADGGYRDGAAADPGALWDALLGGGCWIDEPQGDALAVLRPPVPSQGSLTSWTQPPVQTSDLALISFAARGAAGTTPLSPLLSKLYQESELRPSATTAAMNPKTAARLGLGDRQAVRIEGAVGAVQAELRTDATLPPDRVALAAGPDPAVLHPEMPAGVRGALPLAAETEGSWRGTRVQVREA